MLRRVNRTTMKGFLIFILTCSCSWTHGQRQLVLIKGQKVVYALEAGSACRLELKSKTGTRSGMISGIREFDFTLGSDTIAIRDISRISTGRRPTRASRLGSLVLTGGLGYFAVDQFNNLFSGERSTFDAGVNRTSGILVAAGLSLIWIRKQWDRPGIGRFRLLSVAPDSPFYKKPDMP